MQAKTVKQLRRIERETQKTNRLLEEIRDAIQDEN